MNTLGQGAVLVGMVLAAITVFIIDRRFVWAAGFCAFGAALTLVGLIHSAEVHVFSGEKVALGYAFAAIVCLAFAYLKPPLRELDPLDPEDVEGAPSKVAARRSTRRRPSTGDAPPSRSGSKARPRSQPRRRRR